MRKRTNAERMKERKKVRKKERQSVIRFVLDWGWGGLGWEWKYVELC